MKVIDKIFPFLWHHGETEKDILQEIRKIYECGFRAFCVESRPHPHFCEEQWWRDMDLILQEAQRLGMRVWLLDDKHYPSGRANNAIDKHPELKQTNLICSTVDVCGEMPCAKIMLDFYGTEEELLCALAFPSDGRKIDFYNGVDLTNLVHNDTLYWDIPKGQYRIFAIYKTKQCAEWDFVDILNPKSTALMIEEIYQPHYEHFAEYFGNTFVGFFSDEPRFGSGRADKQNSKIPWVLNGLGVSGMAYPWCDEIPLVLDVRDKRLFVSLWLDLDVPECVSFRVAYMHYLTDCFARNFSGLLAKWCEEHGVMYSAHIIEDEDAHAITCCSSGHYFKTMKPLHIAGVDVVYNQVDLDFIDCTHKNSLTFEHINHEFSNFVLAKLASSSARLDTHKQGRALCEIFGAFGWSESISKMKRLVDFMAVRGINHFIPHAFNPKIDDEDSPPYFYCGGLNPQYDSFKTLSAYMLKLCEIFNGGKMDIRVAVLYNVEAIWSGLEYTKMESVCKYLSGQQIDFDIVPEYEITNVTEEGVFTENCAYKLLIVPYSEYKYEKLMAKLVGYPAVWTSVKELSDLSNVDFSKASTYHLAKENKHLRVCRYVKEGRALYFVTNEGLETYENELCIEENGYYVCEDLQTGIKERGKTEGRLPIRLCVGQSLLFTVGNTPIEELKISIVGNKQIAPTWKIEISDPPFNTWTAYDETKELYDLADWKRLPQFCGKIRYSAVFETEETQAYLDFGTNCNGIRVRLNGIDLGERICSPYLFECADVLRAGKNRIEVVVSTTLGLKKRDEYSHFIAVGKYGLTQNPVLRFYKR